MLIGDLDDVGLLALVLRIELGAAGVVDVPAICMQRHRNVLPDIPDAVNVLRVTARNIAGGHHLLKPLSHGGSQQFILARTVSTDWRTFMYGCPALSGSWQAESFEVA